MKLMNCCLELRSGKLIDLLGDESEPYKFKTIIVTRNWKYSRLELGGG